MARKSVSRWEEIVEESKKGMKIWVGVDVHKESYAVAVLSENGVLHHFRTPSDNLGLIKQFQERGIQISGLVYEAGPTGFGLYRACKEAGIEAMVVAACRVPQTPGKTAKTDRIDCRRLAEYLSNGMLRPITVPSEDQEAERGKVRRRNQVSQEIAKTKERIKSFLLVNFWKTRSPCWKKIFASMCCRKVMCCKAYQASGQSHQVCFVWNFLTRIDSRKRNK